ncbi:MAG: UPF0182 family protein, partial [Thermosynechococcaceae cyanobacterium]
MTWKIPRIPLGRDLWSTLNPRALSVPVWQSIARVALLCLGLIVAADIFCQVLAESLWFSSLGYQRIFMTQLMLRAGLWVFALGATGSILGINLILARRRRYLKPVTLPSQRTTLWALGKYLIIVFGLSLLIICILSQTVQASLPFWQPSSPTSQPLQPFSFSVITLLFKQWGAAPWQLLLVAAGGGLLLLNPNVFLVGASLVLSLGMGVIFSNHWTQVLACFQSTRFNQSDPIFGQDVGFYIFALPVLELLRFWAVGVALVTLASVLLVYLLSGNGFSQGGFPGFLPRQQQHLYGLFAGLMYVLVAGLWLDRFGLLYSTKSVLFGAGYTDSHVSLPAITLLSWGGLAIALFLTGRTCFWTKSRPRYSLLKLLGIYMGCILIGSVVVPQLVQS